MKDKVTVILIAAAAVVVGIILWKRLRVAAPAGAAAGAPTPPAVVPLPAQLSNAFSTLVQQTTNHVSQWIGNQLSGASQGKIVSEKPAPVTGKGPQVAVPAASTPNVVSEATYLA